jgi:adenylate cyclase
MAEQETISLSEASRRSGVPASTLTRWAEEKLVPLTDGKWTPAAAAQARVIGRMRERGHTHDELRDAAKEGRLAFGFAEDVFVDDSETMSVAEAAQESEVAELLGVAPAQRFKGYGGQHGTRLLVVHCCSPPGGYLG